MKRIRTCWLAALLLASAFLHPASGAPPASVSAPAHAAVHEKLDAGLTAALAQPFPADGIAVGVALIDRDLPAPGAARRSAIAERQARVLGALPAGSFRLKRRYESVPGIAGWAQAAAIDALLDHDETAFVYLDGTVNATLAQGRILVGAPAVHSLGFTGVGVRVAVLDTGFDTDHPDIRDDLAAEQCFCDNHPSPNRGCCPGRTQTSTSAEDDDGHGTSVSGIITSSSPSGPGVAPDVEIVAVKVLDSNGGGSFSDIAAGLDWVLTNRVSLGIQLVNVSIGDGSENNNSSVSPCTGTNTATAIKALHAAGVPVFVSSGNDGHDNGISFPACVAEAISVGGVYDASFGNVSWCGNATCTTILCTDNNTAADDFVCHSNSDELLDILAPNYATIAPTLGGGSTTFAGTSASSPYAAAQAALLIQADPTLTPEQIRTLMKTNGPQVVNSDNGLSFTRTDVSLAFAAMSICGNGVVETGESCDDGNTSDGDCCTSTCQLEPAATLCRAAAGICDTAEFCDGSSDTCPADAFEPATTECRAAAGECDVADFCDGGAATCPADAKLISECRAAADVCDAAESCDGSSNTCPADAFEPATTECRAAVAECDAADFCDGGAATCPADAKLTSECRAAADVCDAAESCDGSSNTCPADGFEPATTECRTAIAECDAADFCDGGAASCPADAKLTSECRAAAGVCDTAEVCDGFSDVCPIDEVLDGVACLDGDVCNGDEVCQVGLCAAGMPLNCDDGDECTAESCDAITGCASVPIEFCASAKLPAGSLRSRVALIALLAMAGVAGGFQRKGRSTRGV